MTNYLNNSKHQQAKHTPGPWAVREEDGTIRASDTSLVVVLRSPEPRDMANARLIAAAPETAAERDRLKETNKELLAALKKLVNYSGAPGTHPGSYWSDARAAIAKAEGR